MRFYEQQDENGKVIGKFYSHSEVNFTPFHTIEELQDEQKFEMKVGESRWFTDRTILVRIS